jgi:hypothetical protein
MNRRERSTRSTAATPRNDARRRSPATRRAFLRVMALAGTALAASAASPLAAATKSGTKKRTPAASAPSAAIRKEIENQKGYLAKQLKVIRDFALPVGSEPAFGFRPLSPRRRPGGK